LGKFPLTQGNLVFRQIVDILKDNIFRVYGLGMWGAVHEILGAGKHFRPPPEIRWVLILRALWAAETRSSIRSGLFRH
jgi:hypothetical protein